MWKLNVNRSKTKSVIFGSNTRSIRNEYIFYYNGELLEIVTCYKYLGLLFCNNGNFYRSKVQLKDQAEKAMFSLLNKSNELGLPIDVQLELFDKTVLPVMLYGCEIWGYENIKLFESFYLRYLKYILKLKKSTPNCMLYGELGVYKIDITVKCRMISFWLKLATDDNENKFAVKMFYYLKSLHDEGIVYFKWYAFVKKILDDCGFSHFWYNIGNVNSKWLVEAIKLRLKDQFKQEWQHDIMHSNKTIVYRIYKDTHCYEIFLSKLNSKSRLALCRFRLSNHKLPIERGRFSNIERERRFCQLCNENMIGDEFHFILECPALQHLREHFLPKYCQTCPNTLKLYNLFTTRNMNILNRLCKYIIEASKLI